MLWCRQAAYLSKADFDQHFTVGLPELKFIDSCLTRPKIKKGQQSDDLVALLTFNAAHPSGRTSAGLKEHQSKVQEQSQLSCDLTGDPLLSACMNKLRNWRVSRGLAANGHTNWVGVGGGGVSPVSFGLHLELPR